MISNLEAKYILLILERFYNKLIQIFRDFKFETITKKKTKKYYYYYYYY